LSRQYNVDLHFTILDLIQLFRVLTFLMKLDMVLTIYEQCIYLFGQERNICHVLSCY
jgi:hypothetical protein